MPLFKSHSHRTECRQELAQLGKANELEIILELELLRRKLCIYLIVKKIESWASLMPCQFPKSGVHNLQPVGETPASVSLRLMAL